MPLNSRPASKVKQTSQIQWGAHICPNLNTTLKMSVCLALGLECGIKTTKPDILLWCDPNWCAVKKHALKVGETKAIAPLEQTWTRRTFNRGNTCKSVCRKHGEMCVVIAKCERLYGCDKPNRPRHGKIKIGNKCQLEFKVYPGYFS